MKRKKNNGGKPRNFKKALMITVNLISQHFIQKYNKF